MKCLLVLVIVIFCLLSIIEDSWSIARKVSIQYPSQSCDIRDIYPDLSSKLSLEFLKMLPMIKHDQRDGFILRVYAQYSFQEKLTLDTIRFHGYKESFHDFEKVKKDIYRIYNDNLPKFVSKEHELMLDTCRVFYDMRKLRSCT